MRNNIPIISWFWLVYLIVLPASISSCGSDVEPVKPLESYNAFYMFYPPSVLATLPPIVTIEFDEQGKIKKRIGGVIPTSAYGYTFTADVYDDVTTQPNGMLLVQKENIENFEFADPYQAGIFFDGAKISFIVRPKQESPTLAIHDTTFFYYTGKGVLEKTIRRNWSEVDSDLIFNLEEVRTYTFKKQNLIQIEGRQETSGGIVMTTVEKFENYDGAANPTKALMILDEVFYRSLSRNNFSKYSYEKKTEAGVVTESSFKEWSLKYEGGVPTYR